MNAPVHLSGLPEFQEWVRTFASGLSGNEIILLSGPMGAGKTEFVKTLALVRGATAGASSPTYAFHQEYAGTNGARVDHWDLYRVKSSEELDSVAFWDLLASAPGIVCVEWPERAADAAWPLGRRVLSVSIVPVGAGRAVRVGPVGVKKFV